jgi:hypothetical protein
VYIPLEFDPGTDAQVDWGEAIAIVGGERALFVIRRQESRMQRHPYECPA